jgi:hypothetical protein
MAISAGAVAFSHLQTQFNSTFDPDLANPVSISEFRGATFSSGVMVPVLPTAAISIGTDFRGRTFAAVALTDVTYTFTSQSSASGHAQNWSPSGDMSSWVNGTAAVDGTYWAWTSDKTVKGWNLSNDTDSNSTVSGSTGPAGGGYGGSTGFAYTEVSGSKHLYCFVMRSPAFSFFNYPFAGTKDLTLKLYVHAYGGAMGDLRVYIDNAYTSNDSIATQLHEITSWSFPAATTDWLLVSISLNSYRVIGENHYIYIVSQNATSYYGDMSIDNVQIVQTDPVAAELDLLWLFASQTSNTATGDWSPSGDMSDWENGASATDGTYWAWTSNKTVKGWNLSNDTDSNSTPSGSTGPAGGGYGGSTGFAYTEVSSSRNLYCFVMRTPGTNFSSAMDSTSNDLDLKIYVHAYGGAMGDLRVYIDDATTSNDSAATQLHEITSWSFSAATDDWLLVTVSLNSYRAVDATHYIYIVSQNATSYFGDMSIDNVQILES